MSFHAVAQDLPPGVPRSIQPDGSVYIEPTFTTPAYQKEAFKLVLQEANKVAKELKLPEKLPITEADLTERFIGPFGDGYMYKRVGNITTKKYLYNVARGYKFNGLNIANYDKTCLDLKERGRLPMSQLNTNAAYQMATQWLENIQMDVKALSRDCRTVVEVDKFWNSVNPDEKTKQKGFVPIYNVHWITREKNTRGSVAYVQLYFPTRTILQLSVNNPKYILRQPLIVTNLAELFPGKALIVTNIPSKPIYMPDPGLE